MDRNELKKLIRECYQELNEERERRKNFKDLKVGDFFYLMNDPDKAKLIKSSPTKYKVDGKGMEYPLKPTASVIIKECYIELTEARKSHVDKVGEKYRVNIETVDGKKFRGKWKDFNSAYDELGAVVKQLAIKGGVWDKKEAQIADPNYFKFRFIEGNMDRVRYPWSALYNKGITKMNKGVKPKRQKEIDKALGESIIKEGSFGPGTKVKANLKDKNWKAEIGAIENKNRPEAIYITLSSWVKPKLSVLNAKSVATSDPDSVAKVAMIEFKKEIDMMKRKFRDCFDDKFFDPGSIIFTYDIAAEQARAGKSQFIEFEFNIDTVNDIDHNGDPVQSKDGKMNTIPFKDFVKPTEAAINKILGSQTFDPKKSRVQFSKTKG